MLFMTAEVKLVNVGYIPLEKKSEWIGVLPLTADSTICLPRLT